MRRSQRDHRVPKGVKSVHPRGNPISHSTNGGFKSRRKFSARSRRPGSEPIILNASAAVTVPPSSAFANSARVAARDNIMSCCATSFDLESWAGVIGGMESSARGVGQQASAIFCSGKPFAQGRFSSQKSTNVAAFERFKLKALRETSPTCARARESSAGLRLFIAPSIAIGVGQRSVICRCKVLSSRPSDLESKAVGVRQEPSSSSVVSEYEDPSPEMGGADVSRAEHAPLRIEPEIGQGSENVPHSLNKEPWDVLQEDEAGSHVANDAGDRRPDPPVVVEAAHISGEAERLARESRSEDVHHSAKACAVEGRKVVPDKSAVHGRVSHPRHEDGRRERLSLTVCHSPVGGPERKLEAELEPSNPGT